MIQKKILALIARLIIRTLSLTLRWSVYNESILKKIKEKQNQNVIFAFWHGKQFLLIYSHRNRGVCIMTSLSKDGDLQTDILKGFGFNIVRGSSTRGGARAAVMLLKLIKDGMDVAFAIDGPRGPVYKAKEGSAFLAQKTNRVIIPVACSSQKFWILKKTWDKYMLPKPFSKVAYMYGEPIFVEEKDNILDKTKELEIALNKLNNELDEIWTK